MCPDIVTTVKSEILVFISKKCILLYYHFIVFLQQQYIWAIFAQ